MGKIEQCFSLTFQTRQLKQTVLYLKGGREVQIAAKWRLQVFYWRKFRRPEGCSEPLVAMRRASGGRMKRGGHHALLGLAMGVHEEDLDSWGGLQPVRVKLAEKSWSGRETRKNSVG